MRSIFTLLAVFVISGPIFAAGPDALTLLKRDLGAAIEVISVGEIRYCPDNTCEVFRMQAAQKTSLLPSFVFLYLFHQSSYVYLKKSIEGARPFVQTAADNELSVSAQVANFCKNPKKTAECILKGMTKELGIKVTSGRYDEGKFNES